MPAKLVLIHELGHAKQWVEDPEHWNNMEQFSQRGPVEGFTKWGKLRGSESRSVLAGNFDVAIEYDNLTRHEYPVCDEIGYPKRDNYLDYCCTARVASKRRASANLRRLAQLVLLKARSD